MKKNFALMFLFLFFFSGIISLSAQNNEKKETMILIKTTKGDIKVKLYNETPLHRDNFIKLAKEGFYDNVLFHRVIKDFMIQTGDPESVDAPAEKQLGMGGPGYTIPAEIVADFYHKKGALAAARMPDQMNPNKESSGSQFYIVQGRKYNDNEIKSFEARSGRKFTKDMWDTYKYIGGTPHLDGAYTVFGEVIEGLNVVEDISYVKCGRADRPIEDVKIIKVEILN